MSNLIAYDCADNYRYLRRTSMPRGTGYKPIPSAHVVALHFDRSSQAKSQLAYWIDLRYPGDGISRWWLKRRYPRTTLVSPRSLSPLRKLAKITPDQRRAYWHRFNVARQQWREQSGLLSQVDLLPATILEKVVRWFCPVHSHDVLLQSEVKLVTLDGWIGASYVRGPELVYPASPNMVNPYSLGDSREVVAFIATDPAYQDHYFGRTVNRCWFLDHSTRKYVDGREAIRNQTNAVAPESVHPGCDPLPFKGNIEPMSDITVNQQHERIRKFLEVANGQIAE